MRTLKEQIDNFIQPYLSDSGKPIEAITEYKRYNMELIESHRHLILGFIKSHFNISNGFICLDELLYDKKYCLWNDLSNLMDLEILDSLVGLLIAIGLIEDSFITRINSLGHMLEYAEFLTKEKFCLDDEETLYNYLTTLKEYVLSQYKFSINSDMHEYMSNCLPGSTFDNRIKLKLLAWIKNTSQNFTENDLKLINNFINNNLEGFLNTVVIAFYAKDGADSLIKYLRSDHQFDRLTARIGVMVSNFTDEQRQDLENKKRIFLDKIKLPEDKKRKLQ